MNGYTRYKYRELIKNCQHLIKYSPKKHLHKQKTGSIDKLHKFYLPEELQTFFYTFALQ